MNSLQPIFVFAFCICEYFVWVLFYTKNAFVMVWLHFCVALIHIQTGVYFTRPSWVRFSFWKTKSKSEFVGNPTVVLSGEHDPWRLRSLLKAGLGCGLGTQAPRLSSAPEFKGSPLCRDTCCVGFQFIWYVWSYKKCSISQVFFSVTHAD